MASKFIAKIQAATKALSLFSYQDRSSEEMIQINNRLSITTGNWSAVKEQFIEERYSMRVQEAWSRAEWAKQEQKHLQTIDFSEYQDRQVLKERYSKELSKIINGRTKSNEQRLSFKWIGKEPQLRQLFSALKPKYIEATLKDFQSLFSAQEIKMIKPIQWKANAWELSFLIAELANHLKLIEDSKVNDKIVDCFINKNGEPFKSNSVKAQKSTAKVGMAGSAIKEKNLKSILDTVKQAGE
jgi:hypothetical protein